jgi:hypothetical protein
LYIHSGKMLTLIRKINLILISLKRSRQHSYRGHCSDFIMEFGFNILLCHARKMLVSLTCGLTGLKTLLILLCLQFLFQFNTNSQIYEHPNFSFSSHETLELERVEVDANQTRVYFSILNRKLGGTFCMDTSTYIKNSLGSEEYKLLESIGVPDCPDVHKFSIVGKKLSFILVFPPISKEIRYIDIIENCQVACLSVRYVLLDTIINKRINEALSLYESRKLKESLAAFENLLLSSNDNVSPVFGTIYLYMMSINYELGQSKEIRRLYDDLEQSSIINKEEILEEARYQEIVR